MSKSEEKRYESQPYGKEDPRFPGKGRGSNGQGELTPGEKMRQDIKEKFRQQRSSNREESIQMLLEELKIGFTTEYQTREETDSRHYIPSYFGALRDRYGYSFDNPKAVNTMWEKLRLIKAFIDHGDMSMIPYKRQRAGEYVQPLLNPQGPQDPMNVLRDLFRDRSEKK